jgi:hypothetical protein
MTSDDPEECNGGTLWSTPALFPVAKRVNADTHRASELRLGQASKASERCDVVTRLEMPGHQTPANTCGDGACELLLGEFGNVGHVVLLRWARNSDCSNGVAQRALMILTSSSCRSVQTTRTKPLRIGPMEMKRSSSSELSVL